MLFFTGASAQDSNWQPVTGTLDLQAFMSGRVLTIQESSDSLRRGEYRADGTGTLYAWGGQFDRSWEVKGEDQICVNGDPVSACYQIEKNKDDPLLYRVTEVSTGTVTEMREETPGGMSVVSGAGPADSNQGGAAAPSADELAAKLANPTNPIMKIGNNFDYVWFDGDLPDADDQSSFRYVFLTVIPFKLDNGKSILVRPGIPVMFNQPVPDGSGGFSKEGTDIGDTVYDVLYSGTNKSGLIYGYGLAGTLPTASNDKLGKDLWGLGPEAVLGVAKKWGVFGGLLSHQWDIGGSGLGSINTTTLNYFYSFPLGGGWQFASAPAITYNHDATSGNKLTLPLGVGISKTTVIGKRPWTFHLQYWNNVARPDAFAAQHTIRFTVLPVVSAPWNEGK
jgi:hypothetical protein